MYASYQITPIEFKNPAEFLQRGLELERENRARVRKSLKSFMTPNGEIDASEMMKEWFENISANVFISHSRADKDLALTLSGWLLDVFGLSSFVDSCAWGHAIDLLKEIDNECCYQSESNTYSYQRRNVTTSHVHLMLSTGLSQMLDRCECVFFLNSENSLKPVSIRSMAESEEEHITQSPWLFHELSMLRLLRRREKEEHRPGMVKKADFAEARAAVPAFNYPVSLANLPSLGVSDFNQWSKQWQEVKGEEQHALDSLYEIKSPDCRKAILG